jgi:hypothetical protein
MASLEESPQELFNLDMMRLTMVPGILSMLAAPSHLDKDHPPLQPV